MYFFGISDVQVFVQSKDPSDFQSSSLSTQVTFLDITFTVCEESFKQIPSNSIVVLDDFSFYSQLSNQKEKQLKTNFLHIVNYYLRHHNITLFLIIHNLYSTGLLHNILLAPHLFITYSSLGYYIIQKLQTRIGGTDVMSFWQEPQKCNFHFCYINNNRNYIINCVEQLFSGHSATMFANKKTFIIHEKDKPCLENETTNNVQDNSIESTINEYLLQMYPKNKHLKFVFKPLLSHNLISENLFFIPFPHVHIADFCSFLNNRLQKQSQVNPTMIKLCKYIQQMHLKVPKIAIKNPVAQKYLT